MLRRPATVLTLTSEDIADYEDRAAERIRAAELEARQRAAEAHARARHDASSATAALRRAALAAATPTVGSSASRYHGNGATGIDFHGTRVLSSPAEHQFSDDEEEESDVSEMETSYYARAQSQAARVSLARGQALQQARGYAEEADDDDEEQEVEMEYDSDGRAIDDQPPQQRRLRNPQRLALDDNNFLPSSQPSAATTAPTETPPNPRDTRHGSTNPPAIHQPRRTVRERTAEATPPIRETRRGGGGGGGHAQQADAPPPPPVRETRTRSTRGASAGAGARRASTSSPPPAPTRATAATTRTRGPAGAAGEQPPTARETRRRSHAPAAASADPSAAAAAAAAISAPSSQLVAPTTTAAGSGTTRSVSGMRGGSAAAAVTPEARVQRSRDERIGVAAPRRGRSHQAP
ncbi:hypothetical protein C7999DRAFT_32729 [Corynascus novoguineensis]|uniref:Anaphase-promoting complex, subunit CDC26 n=1 Tax=Corynascus novoguineensis TaxID=1126955 RepID=A0AAN7CR90_9PEZI|nr:hypothetical protein C7999DRAFT_32729 [Corynascus novoguineensis]